MMIDSLGMEYYFIFIKTYVFSLGIIFKILTSLLRSNLVSTLKSAKKKDALISIKFLNVIFIFAIYSARINLYLC